MSDEPATAAEGWAAPVNTRRWHYFRDGRSLCGRWGYFGSLWDQSLQYVSKDCAECRRRRDAEKVESS